MPRLDFLVPGDLATLTGGYVYDRRMVEGLRVRGWTVEVGPLDGSFPEPSVAALGHARRVLARIPAGALVLVDGLALGAMPDLAEAESQRLRLVALVHHPLAEETGLSPARARALRESERRALAAVAGVLVTSRFTARLLSDYGVAPDRIQAVEPGTDPAAPARGSGTGTPSLLCVAALVPRKGHLLLLEAMAELADRDWRLECVGSLDRDPATVEAVRTRIDRPDLAERVWLAGELDETALASCYARADLFVLPTRFEGYGMALAEALARGLPVISTRVGAVPDTVPPEAGILVPAGDTAALRAALRQVLDDPTLRRHLEAGALAARDRLPTWEDASLRMAEALERIRAS